MKRLKRILLSLPFLITAGVIALYALLGFVVAPWYLKRALPDYLRENLQATGSVGDVRINPFVFTLEARDFALTESGGKNPAIAFDRLFVDFELSSIFRLAWTFADITFERPRINLEIDAKDNLNLSKLTPPAKTPAKDPGKPSPPPRLLLQNFDIKAGSVTFSDLGIPGKASARLEPIELQLHDLSTLPDHDGNYTLSARLPAGGSLNWRGSLKLAPVASEGQVEVRDLKLATLWRFLQDTLLIESPSGSMDASLRYRTRYAENKFDATADGLALKLSGMEVKLRDQKEALLRIDDAALRAGTFNLGARSLQFAELAVNKVYAHTLVEADGSVNWSKLVAPGPDKPPGAPWKIAVDAITLSDAALRVDDRGFVKPLTFEVGRAALKAALKMETGATPTALIEGLALDFSNLLAREPDARDALFSLADMNLAGGSFDLAQRRLQFTEWALAKGTLNLAVDAAGNNAFQRRPSGGAKPPAEAKPAAAAPWQIAVNAVRASEFALRMTDQSYARPLAFEITRAGAQAGISVETGDKLKLEAGGIAVDLNGIRVAEAGAKDNLISLAGAVLAGGKFQLQQNRFTADSLRLARPGAQIVRDAGGAINLAGAFASKLPPRPAVPGAKPMAVEIRSVELADGAVQFIDRGQPPLNLDMHAIRVLARDVSNLGRQPVRLDAGLQIKQGGSLRVQGTVTPARQRASLRIESKDIALAPVAPLLAHHTTLKLRSGNASSSGQIEWNGAAKSADLRYSGSAAVDGLQLDEEASGEKFAAWQQLRAEDMNIDIAGRSARIGDLRLVAPFGKIVIAKDRSTNLGGIMRKPAAPASPAPTAPVPAASAPAPAPKSEPFVVAIERVHVANGELDFADLSLVLPFAAVIRELNGGITGLSSQPGTRAGVKLEGRVDEFGQAQVGGSINPFEPKAYTDLAVTFRNVALSPLTPYSATFAGRRIATGRLSLDLQYKLNNSQLQGENKVLLEQFTLGERVESPTAVNLPLDLAIALLTDSSGRINLSVPVRGNVDAPEFSYGHIVWQAIRTVITNIVTAPFRALASLFGGSAEKVDAIAFEAGRAQLSPPEREKLVKVAAVLKQRPNLKLMVQGRYDSRHDGAALRRQATYRLLAERQGIKLAGPDDPALPNPDNAKTQRAIEALLEERAGAGGIDKFKAEHEKKTGKEAKRVNAALALIGRGSPDREFYEAMLTRAAELQPLNDAALQALATQRGTAIAEHLKTAGGLEAARVALDATAKIDAEKSTDITASLNLAPLKP